MLSGWSLCMCLANFYTISYTSQLLMAFIQLKFNTPLAHTATASISQALSPTCDGFDYNWQHGLYTLHWDSIQAIKLWRKQEETENAVEFHLKQMKLNKKPIQYWLEAIIYICAYQGIEGKKQYTKKHPEWTQKIDHKQIDCFCWVQIKIYLNQTTSEKQGRSDMFRQSWQ